MFVRFPFNIIISKLNYKNKKNFRSNNCSEQMILKGDLYKNKGGQKERSKRAEAAIVFL